MSRSGDQVRRSVLNVVLVAMAVLCSGTGGQSPAPISKRDSDGSGGSGGHEVQVNQIDLFSGTPALIAVIAAFIQILPLPVYVFKPSLARFLDWLQLSIEQDFGITLRTCHGQCLGCKYQSTPYRIKEWVSVSAGVKKPIDCTSPDTLSAAELAQIIQANGNGDMFLRLARLTRYPQMHELTIGVRAIQYSPHAGHRFVAFQWLGLFLSYAYHLVFFNELVDIIQATYRFLNTVYRVRVMLLCTELGFAPPHFITGSFHTIDLANYDYVIHMSHPTLAETYRALFNPNNT
ncbi:hypothetical protein GGF46_004484 [Coemansia sp. RSA 552]|nr:hypothetical protein GGF46_004484 [Coemansia sp. RSA 552]